jgi:hypothetical protein
MFPSWWLAKGSVRVPTPERTTPAEAPTSRRRAAVTSTRIATREGLLRELHRKPDELLFGSVRNLREPDGNALRSERRNRVVGIARMFKSRLFYSLSSGNSILNAIPSFSSRGRRR